MNTLDLDYAFRRIAVLAAIALWASTSPVAWGRTTNPHHSPSGRTHRPPAHGSRPIAHAPPIGEMHGRAISKMHGRAASETQGHAISEMHGRATRDTRARAHGDTPRRASGDMQNHPTHEAHRRGHNEARVRAHSDTHRRTARDTPRHPVGETHGHGPPLRRLAVVERPVEHAPSRHEGAERAVARSLHAAAAAKPLIVIDPGHGGKDPGAIGLFHIEEKDVVLRTALALRKLLEATGRYRVAMTRTTDVFIPLFDRLRFARDHHAALFISIHANISADPAAHGACVYVRTPSLEGDRITHVAGGPGAGSGIASALDPRSGAGSAGLQSHLIDQLEDDIPVTTAPARQGHLYVLASHSIPSVLLEMGFLSNRQDATHLRQVHYRLTIAEAIRDAINDYFAELKQPPALPT